MLKEGTVSRPQTSQVAGRRSAGPCWVGRKLACDVVSGDVGMNPSLGSCGLVDVEKPNAEEWQTKVPDLQEVKEGGREGPSTPKPSLGYKKFPQEALGSSTKALLL